MFDNEELRLLKFIVDEYVEQETAKVDYKTERLSYNGIIASKILEKLEKSLD